MDLNMPSIAQEIYNCLLTPRQPAGLHIDLNSRFATVEQQAGRCCAADNQH